MMLMATESWVAVAVVGAIVLLALSIAMPMVPMVRRYLNMRRM